MAKIRESTTNFLKKSQNSHYPSAMWRTRTNQAMRRTILPALQCVRNSTANIGHPSAWFAAKTATAKRRATEKKRQRKKRQPENWATGNTADKKNTENAWQKICTFQRAAYPRNRSRYNETEAQLSVAQFSGCRFVPVAVFYSCLFFSCPFYRCRFYLLPSAWLIIYL